MLSRAKPAGAKGLDAAINVPGTPTQVLVYPVWKEIHKIDVQTLCRHMETRTREHFTTQVFRTIQGCVFGSRDCRDFG